MASSIQLLRSVQNEDRPFAQNLLEGQPAVNLNSSEPGLFFKLTDGSVVKFGPVSVTSDGVAPNSSPKGSPGNSKGELWFDTSTDPGILRIYDGDSWVIAGSGGGGGGGGEASLLRWSAISTENQTTFSGEDSDGVNLAYTPGLEQVSVNGVIMTRGVDYEAEDGISLVFTGTGGLQDNDEVTVFAWSAFSIGTLPSRSVTGGKIALDTIKNENIEAGTISGGAAGRIAENTLTAFNIAPNTITGGEIAEGTVTAFNIEPGTITGTEIDDNTITASNIESGTITDSEISGLAANRIDSDKVKITWEGLDRSLGQKASDWVSVKDFGATGDGTTDDAPFVQAAVDYCEANNIGTVFFPFQNGETYRFNSTVVILRGEMELFGTAPNAGLPTKTGYVFSDENNITLFDYGNNTSTPSSAFTVKGIVFKAKRYAGQTAIKFSNANNGPHRAVTFRDCSFWGFDKALLFDTPGGTIAPSFVDIQDCQFREGNYAILANDQLIGLRIVACQVEVGAKVHGYIDGWCTISQCLLESNENFLNITGAGSCSVHLHDNYLEDNNGNYHARINKSNAAFTVVRAGYDYNGSGSRTDWYRVGSVSFINESNRPSSQILTLETNGTLYPGSSGISSGYKMIATGSGIERCVSYLDAKEFVGTYSAADTRQNGFGGTKTVLTPHGVITNAKSYTGDVYTDYATLSKAISAGDVVVVSFLVRYEVGSRPTGAQTSPLLETLDNTFAPIGGGGGSYPVWDQVYDVTGWKLLTFSFVSGVNTPTVRARLRPFYDATGSTGEFVIGGAALRSFTPSTNRPTILPMYPVI